ncbi:MAG: ABC transporter substrate-binding protein [Clostridia bacterium]|nr:ABC transporter substrate-binding protein [Clostridia bacterium]
MTKRITAFILATVCLLCCLSGCHDRKIDGEDVKGAEIPIYLCDQVYELDPALCLVNDSAYQICSLIYDTLFTLDANGKIQKSIVKSYEIKKDEKNKEYSMLITLKPDNYWSDGTPLSAEDVVFAWKRILDPAFSSDACALLYDILNAREAKQGDCSIDDVGIYAVDQLVLQVTFVGDIDYNAFLLNLCSVALAPLRERVVEKNGDWAKKPATTVNSGPFMIRRVNYGFDTSNYIDSSFAQLVLERNPFYRRAKDAKYLDTSVSPYRLIIDFSLTGEELLSAYASGEIFYVGEIPLDSRGNYKDTADINATLSAHTYYLNENADIKKADGTTEKLFANKNVRLALSAAIDRQAIADKVVFAKPATGFVTGKAFENGNSKTLFRTVGGDLFSAAADSSAAKSYIAASGINPADYTFAISVPAYDKVHIAIAEMVCAAWCDLGFNVTVSPVNLSVNDEKLAGEDVKDIFDDIFVEKFYANGFAVCAIDAIAPTADAFSVLAPFATEFSGQGQELTSAEYVVLPHRTGFASDAYNELIEKAYKAVGAERAALLHDAEKLLAEEMPVIPVIFNQTATLTSADLKNVKTDYFGFNSFTKVSLKNWIDYIETVAPSDAEEAAK